MRLSDITRNLRGIFERKRKNPVQLSNDSNLESNLKPLKVSNKNTPIQISEDTVDVQGSLKVNGVDVSTEPDVGAITALNNATANELVTVGATTTELDAHSGLTYDGATLKVESNSALASQLILVDNGVVQGSFNVDSFGHLTIDANGGAAKISLDSQSGCVNFYKAGTQFGEINMGTSSTLKLLSASNYHINITSSGTGDVVLDSNGDIVIDSADGNFIAKKGGTEFSAANSSYAGMILGYTCIGLNEADASYNLTTSYAVPTDEFSVEFTAPPSGNVEIFIQFTWSAGSSNFGDCYAGLSTANATSGYSATISYHEKEIFDQMSRGAYRTLTHRWTITGLTAGTSYERWVGFKTSNTTGTPQILYGGNGSGEYPNFIMKATALPETITT